MRRLLIVAALLLATLAAPAGAGAADWCDTDPLVLITTPGGNVAPVYVLVGAAGLEHLPAVQAASILSTTETVAARAGGQATRVTLTVTVPDDAFAIGFPTRAAASSGPPATGTVYDQTTGSSGQAMVLRFTLPVP
jgi:hypothetical protein